MINDVWLIVVGGHWASGHIAAIATMNDVTTQVLSNQYDGWLVDYLTSWLVVSNNLACTCGFCNVSNRYIHVLQPETNIGFPPDCCWKVQGRIIFLSSISTNDGRWHRTTEGDEIVAGQVPKSAAFGLPTLSLAGSLPWHSVRDQRGHSGWSNWSGVMFHRWACYIDYGWL